MISNQFYPPVEVMPKAKRAAQKALEIDETLAEAHATLALVMSVYEFDRSGGEKEFRRALELKPSDAEAHLWYGLHLAGLGRFNEAVAEVEQAQKLDPASPAMSAYVGAPLYLAHRYDEVIRRLQPIAETHPALQQAHAFLALAYEQKRDWTNSVKEMERAYELEKEPQSLAQLGHIYAASGRTADARRILRQLQELAHNQYVTAYDIGLLYAGLGEREEAFQWLEKVNQDRSEWFAMVNVDPRLEALHSDPRFQAVLRSVGLAR
jgi:Flp pilus assembly protein TadD